MAAWISTTMRERILNMRRAGVLSLLGDDSKKRYVIYLLHAEREPEVVETNVGGLAPVAS